MEYVEIIKSVEERRFQAAVAAMQGMLSNPHRTGDSSAITKFAVEYADALLAKLAESSKES